MWLVMNIKKGMTTGTKDCRIPIEFSSLEKGCVGVALVFKKKADAKKFAGDAEIMKVTTTKTQGGNHE